MRKGTAAVIIKKLGSLILYDRIPKFINPRPQNDSYQVAWIWITVPGLSNGCGNLQTKKDPQYGQMHIKAAHLNYFFQDFNVAFTRRMQSGDS